MNPDEPHPETRKGRQPKKSEPERSSKPLTGIRVFYQPVSRVEVNLGQSVFHGLVKTLLDEKFTVPMRCKRVDEKNRRFSLAFEFSFFFRSGLLCFFNQRVKPPDRLPASEILIPTTIEGRVDSTLLDFINAIVVLPNEVKATDGGHNPGNHDQQQDHECPTCPPLVALLNFR